MADSVISLCAAFYFAKAKIAIIEVKPSKTKTFITIVVAFSPVLSEMECAIKKSVIQLLFLFISFAFNRFFIKICSESHLAGSLISFYNLQFLLNRGFFSQNGNDIIGFIFSYLVCGI